MQKHLISILVPFKNTESYLVECLDSIVNKPIPIGKLLIVDDGSTDASYELVQNYANTDARIHLLRNDGSGIIEALRTGYKQAKGTFMTRMDSDDVMALNKLEQMQQSLITHGEGHLALGSVRYFSEAGIGNGYKRYETWLNALTSQRH